MIFKKREKTVLRPDLQKVMDEQKIRGEKQAKQLINTMLKDTETVEFALPARKDKRVGMVVLTTERLLFAAQTMGNPDIFSVDRGRILGIDSATNHLKLATFTVNTTGQNTEFDIAEAKKVFELIKLVN